MSHKNSQWQILAGLCIFGSTLGTASLATAQDVIEAVALPAPIKVDGDVSEWAGVRSYHIGLTGRGGVESVDMKFAIHGDTIYVSAVWQDATENRLHKPYRWDETTLSYGRSRQMEDRFAMSFHMSGDFSHNKVSGAEFIADVWHWKASRSDPAGIAHDKMWRVSHTEFPNAKAFTGPDGRTIYIARLSDSGDRLYRPIKHDIKVDELMPRYDVNLSPQGSIADVRAKGVWRNGRWYLELARKLNTGHDDDAVIPAAGRILFAVAAFDNVDADNHSTSRMLLLQTGNYGN